jgi:hypothetical protein
MHSRRALLLTSRREIRAFYVEPGTRLSAVSRLNSRTTWYSLATTALLVSIAFLGAMLAGTPHVWTGSLMIVAYCLAAAALGAGYCGNAGVRFPVLGEDPPPEPSFPIMGPGPDADPRSEMRQALDLHRPGQLGEALDANNVHAQSSDQRWLRVVNQLAEIAGWDIWPVSVAPFFDPNSPWVSARFTERLQQANEWIFSRAWPPGRPGLREAVDTYGRVVADLLSTFRQHSEESPDGKAMMTERFYKNRGNWNLRYEDDLAEYRHHIALLQDLVLEATRYANHIAELVRRELDPDFRTEEGALLVRIVYGDFQVGLLKPEFRREDFENGQPYRDLQAFEDDRAGRDVAMKFDAG